MIQDGNERITVSRFIEPKYKNLRFYIEQVDKSPQNFNAIPLTIFFANDMHGNYFDSNTEYKIY